MHYYRSQELAELYGVSRRTVTNWVEQARRGRLDIELTEKAGNYYVAKTNANQAAIKDIVRKRRKYLNTRSLKRTTPKSEFYQIYSEAQILDLIYHIDIHKEVPMQYTYMGDGASLWNEYITKQYSEGNETASSLKAAELLNININYINNILDSYGQVNIVDLGVGNGFTVKDLLAHTLERGKLNRYIAIDISKELLEISKNNIAKWFDNKVRFEGHVLDLTFQPFTDIIAEPPDPETRDYRTINLVMLLGGTLSNFRKPEDVLSVISKSLGAHDLFFSSFKIATHDIDEHLGFVVRYHTRTRYVLDLLGVDETMYEVEVGYDTKERLRYGRIRLKHALTIEFRLSRGTWWVDLQKDDTLLTIRANDNKFFKTPEKLIYANGLNPLLMSRTRDHEAMMVIADLRKAND